MKASISRLNGEVLWQTDAISGKAPVVPEWPADVPRSSVMEKVHPVFFDFTHLLSKQDLSLTEVQNCLATYIDGMFDTFVRRHRTVLEDPEKLPGRRRYIPALQVIDIMPKISDIYEDARGIVQSVYSGTVIQPVPLEEESFDIFATPSGRSRFDMHFDGNHPNIVANLSESGVEGMTVLGDRSALEAPADERFNALMSGAGSLAIKMQPGVAVILDVFTTPHVGVCVSEEGAGTRQVLDMNFRMANQPYDGSVAGVYSR